jgi:PAS domain S-box-containing protein
LFFSLIEGDEKNTIYWEFQDVIKEKTSVESEFCIKRKDGIVRYILGKATSIADNTGKVISVEGTMQDITERKQAEINQKESERKYWKLFDESPLPKFIFDSNTFEILETNSAALAKYGYTKEEFLKMTINNLRPTEDVDKFIATIRGFDYNIKNYKGQWRHQKKTGEIIIVEITAHPITFNNRPATMSIALDITETLKAQQDLYRINERYKYATKATSDAIWDWNLLTQEFYLTDGYYKLFGYNQQEKVSIRNWLKRIHPDDRRRVTQYLREQLFYREENIPWEIEYRYIKKDGSIAFILDKGHSVFDNLEKSSRMIGAMQDITSKKQFEKEREKITKDLIQRNKELEQFTYIVSHNLRSPVANILGCIEIINDPTFDHQTQQEMIGWLSIATKKMDTVIKDLNYILQMKQDVREQNEEVRFENIVKDIKTGIIHLVENQQVEIHFDFTQKEFFRSTKSYIYSIFFNLISNSIKFKKSDEPARIVIRTEQLNDSFEIVFKDNGLGIDLQNKGDKIFGLYKRFHDHVDGKGMGLFMVKTQVETLGGKISISSEVNVGTEFRVRFWE